MIDQISTATRRSLGSFFYVGFLPGAPSTYASLLVIIHLLRHSGAATFWFSTRQMHSFLIGYAILVLMAIWICSDAKDTFGKSIAPQMVLPNILGQLIVFFLLPINAGTLLMGFAFYRFFDIVKPWPLFLVSELNKGFGIVLHTVLAGVFASLCLHGSLWAYHGILSYLS